MPAIAPFLEKVKNILSHTPECRFWELLEEAESLCETVQESREGTIHPAAIIEDKVVLGKGAQVLPNTLVSGTLIAGENTVVGPNVEIRGFVILGNHCMVKNSQLKNVIMLDHSNSRHYSTIGDSVLGENVNLGAGTQIANLRFDNANVKVSINGEKTDSGRRKLGCLMAHNTKTGINSSVNSGVIIGNNCHIYPNRFVNRNVKDHETFR